MEHLFHFLRESKEHFLNKKFDRVVHIFLGNEACDADSFISSVLYGYLSANIKSSNNSNTLMLPLIPIPKSDLSLRTEIAFLLQKSGFTCWAEVLLFIDEFSIEILETLHKKHQLKVTLLDHNEPKCFWKNLTDSVVEVIDHHEDSGLYTKQASRIVNVEIDKVGSATTLVAERFFRENASLITPVIAMLLLGPILLDTVNLNPQRHRVTPKDEVVAKKLLTIAQINQNVFFEELQTAKFNDESLTTWDKLRKDYKGGQVGNIKYGISSVLTSVKMWIQQDPDLVNRFRDWMKVNGNLDILFVGLAYYDTQKTFHRELIIYSSHPELSVKVSEKLPNEFKLIPMQDNDILELIKQTPGLLLFTVGNVDVARKILQPAIESILKSQL